MSSTDTCQTTMSPSHTIINTEQKLQQHRHDQSTSATMGGATNPIAIDEENRGQNVSPPQEQSQQQPTSSAPESIQEVVDLDDYTFNHANFKHNHDNMLKNRHIEMHKLIRAGKHPQYRPVTTGWGSRFLPYTIRDEEEGNTKDCQMLQQRQQQQQQPAASGMGGADDPMVIDEDDEGNAEDGWEGMFRTGGECCPIDIDDNDEGNAGDREMQQQQQQQDQHQPAVSRMGRADSPIEIPEDDQDSAEEGWEAQFNPGGEFCPIDID